MKRLRVVLLLGFWAAFVAACGASSPATSPDSAQATTVVEGTPNRLPETGSTSAFGIWLVEGSTVGDELSPENLFVLCQNGRGIIPDRGVVTWEPAGTDTIRITSARGGETVQIDSRVNQVLVTFGQQESYALNRIFADTSSGDLATDLEGDWEVVDAYGLYAPRGSGETFHFSAEAGGTARLDGELAGTFEVVDDSIRLDEENGAEVLDTCSVGDYIFLWLPEASPLALRRITGAAIEPGVVSPTTAALAPSSPTAVATDTPPPTATPLPTNTPPPTETPFPTETPSPTATSTVTPIPTDTPIPGPTPAPGEVMYEANWSGGLNGWSGTPDWKAAVNMLVNDGTGSWYGTWATAPFIPPVANYAVEAEIQFVRGNNSCNAFGIFVRAMKFPEDGYIAVSNTCPPDIQVYPGWPTSGELETAQFSRDEEWHTYRVEVQGIDIRVLVDGGLVLETMDSRYLEPGKVGLGSKSAAINVRSFRVIALGP